jgi:hypothetical protein
VGSSATLDAATPQLYVDCGLGGVARRGGTMRSSGLLLRHAGGGGVTASCLRLGARNFPVTGELLDPGAPATLERLPVGGIPPTSQRLYGARIQLLPIETPNDVALVFYWDPGDLANAGITDPTTLRLYRLDPGEDWAGRPTRARSASWPCRPRWTSRAGR